MNKCFTQQNVCPKCFQHPLVLYCCELERTDTHSLLQRLISPRHSNCSHCLLARWSWNKHYMKLSPIPSFTFHLPFSPAFPFLLSPTSYFSLFLSPSFSNSIFPSPPLSLFAFSFLFCLSYPLLLPLSSLLLFPSVPLIQSANISSVVG